MAIGSSRYIESCRSAIGAARTVNGPGAGRQEAAAMNNRILVFYGSYRSDRMGIRLAQFVVERLRRRGDDVELIDAKAIGLPILDKDVQRISAGQSPRAH